VKESALNMIQTWIASQNNSISQFLQRLDVEGAEEAVELALRNIFTKTSADINFSKVELLTPEVAIYWRVYVQYLKDTKVLKTSLSTPKAPITPLCFCYF
jgi:hypothetical protein